MNRRNIIAGAVVYHFIWVPPLPLPLYHHFAFVGEPWSNQHH
jgi:hypothetical protein